MISHTFLLICERKNQKRSKVHIAVFERMGVLALIFSFFNCITKTMKRERMGLIVHKAHLNEVNTKLEI